LEISGDVVTLGQAISLATIATCLCLGAAGVIVGALLFVWPPDMPAQIRVEPFSIGSAAAGIALAVAACIAAWMLVWIQQALATVAAGVAAWRLAFCEREIREVLGAEAADRWWNARHEELRLETNRASGVASRMFER
jgi:hypothetical protein